MSRKELVLSDGGGGGRVNKGEGGRPREEGGGEDKRAPQNTGTSLRLFPKIPIVLFIWLNKTKIPQSGLSSYNDS